MSSVKLYELADAYRQIEAMLDDESIDDNALLKAIDDVDLALQEKATNVVMFIENLRLVANAKKSSAQRMTEQAKAIENRIEHIKSYVLACMHRANINKISCPEFTIAIRNNPPRVVVTDQDAIPASYWRQPEIPDPVVDKKKIADDIKAGCIIDGVHLEESQRLEIK